MRAIGPYFAYCTPFFTLVKRLLAELSVSSHGLSVLNQCINQFDTIVIQLMVFTPSLNIYNIYRNSNRSVRNAEKIQSNE